MLILHVFSIYDKKVGNYSAPFYSNHVANATRIFSDLVNTPNSDSLINKYPEDYDLYKVGIFDDTTANLLNLDGESDLSNPLFICNGASLLINRGGGVNV